MAEFTPVGVDINGLQDVAAFELNAEQVVGGAIPSVVIVGKSERGRSEIIAGEEATHAFAGRGWAWPYDETEEDRDASATRIPLTEILRRLQADDHEPITGGGSAAEDMYAEAVSALVNTRAHMGAAPKLTLAIPDDGRYGEEVQQRILNAARVSGLDMQLLWRSVAAVLGMAEDLQPLHRQLKGREIAVLSCLDDGISVNRLRIDIEEDPEGVPYIVPERSRAGTHFPFSQSVTTCAREIADKIGNEIGIDGHQVLWGDGLPLRWLLNQPDRDGFFQSNGGWHRYPGQQRDWFADISVPETLVQRIHEVIFDVDNMIIEGPAVKTSTANKSLMYFLRDALKDLRPSRITLGFKDGDAYLAPIGCVEYGQRRLDGKRAYYDFLPQLRLAVRREEQAVFVSLIPSDEKCEGGEEYDEEIDLGVTIPQGAERIEFYLLREGASAPRYAVENLPFATSEVTPIRMRVQQRPAQGRARLTVESASASVRMPRLDVNWDNMEVLRGQTEADIVEVLEREVQVFVPPVQPHPCHAFLWTFKPQNQDLLTLSLSDRVAGLDERTSPDDALPLNEIKDARTLLSRFQSPSILTRHWGRSRHPSQIKARPVSSEGDLPALTDGLTADTLAAFDHLLETMAARFEARGITRPERDQIVTFSAWAFARCPQSIRDSLRVAASSGEVVTSRNDFEAMGRAFTTKEELEALYSAVHAHASGGQQGRLLAYHANALFNSLSLREIAPFALTSDQARDFVKLAIPAIEEKMSQGAYKRLMSVSIKTIGGLIRYRLVDPGFLDPGEYLGERVRKLLKEVQRRSEGHSRRTAMFKLAQEIIAVLDKQSVSDTILQWPSDEDE